MPNFPFLTNRKQRDNTTDKDNQTIEETDHTDENECALDTVIGYFKDIEWDIVIKHRDDRTLIATNGTGQNGSFRIIVDVKEELDIVLVYVSLPVVVPQEKRIQVAEFITLANFGIVLGNFELDMGDGELRYKGATAYTGGQLTRQMVNHLVMKCSSTMDYYFPGLLKVIYGNASAGEAIREIEPVQARSVDNSTEVEALAIQVLGEALEGVAANSNDSGSEDEDVPTVSAEHT